MVEGLEPSKERSTLKRDGIVGVEREEGSSLTEEERWRKESEYHLGQQSGFPCLTVHIVSITISSDKEGDRCRG